MLINIKKIQGLPIYAKDTAEKLENIDDAIFDDTSKKLVGFLVKEAGLVSEPKAIAFSAIQSIGLDAVWVDNKQAMQPAKQLLKSLKKEAKNDNYLSKAEIITESGIVLGRIIDVYFDPLTGAVTHFEFVNLSEDLSLLEKKVIMLDQVVHIGKDAVVVLNTVAQQVAQEAPLNTISIPSKAIKDAQTFISEDDTKKQQKSLKAVLKKATGTDKYPKKVLEAVKSKVSDISGQAKQKMQS